MKKSQSLIEVSVNIEYNKLVLIPNILLHNKFNWIQINQQSDYLFWKKHLLLEREVQKLNINLIKCYKCIK